MGHKWPSNSGESKAWGALRVVHRASLAEQANKRWSLTRHCGFSLGSQAVATRDPRDRVALGAFGGHRSLPTVATGNRFALVI